MMREAGANGFRFTMGLLKTLGEEKWSGAGDKVLETGSKMTNSVWLC